MQERLIYIMTTHTIVVIHCIPFVNQLTQKNHSQNSYTFRHAFGALATAFAILTFALAFMSSFALVK